MQFQFVVGEQERHHVHFSFDKFSGHLVVAVDGVPIMQRIRFASVRLTKRYTFTVGSHEQHQVTIEKHRKLFLAGFRPQTARAFVDGRLVAETTE